VVDDAHIDATSGIPIYGAWQDPTLLNSFSELPSNHVKYRLVTISGDDYLMIKGQITMPSSGSGSIVAFTLSSGFRPATIAVTHSTQHGGIFSIATNGDVSFTIGTDFVLSGGYVIETYLIPLDNY
jgi:hypothetical protein